MALIDCYVTLNSPWSYLGYERLGEIAKRHGARVDIKPVNFSQIFADTGGLPLAKRAPARRVYRMMELRRWRDFLAIPIVLEPKYFPADEALGVRLVLAARRAGVDVLALTHKIGQALWERDEDISQPQVLARAAASAGLDADALLAAAGPADLLDADYAALTREALSRGVFGAPGFVLETGEVFWGQDRLDFLDRALAASN